jgi:ribonuclease HI
MAAMQCIESLGVFQWLIFTDGTPGVGGGNSGAAAVMGVGTPGGMEVREVRRRRGGVGASPFDAEVEGLRLALEWLRVNHSGTEERVLIGTDCQALVQELAAPVPPDDSSTQELRELLDDLPQSITIQWIPGHCGLLGNEVADRESRLASTERGVVDDPGKGITLWAAKARIRRKILDPPTSHARTKAIYQGTRGVAVLTRKEAVLLAQLRSGHCRRLAAYHSVVEEGFSPTCPHCGTGPEDVEHWLQSCPATAQKRRDAFGTTSPPMSILFQDQVAVRAFCQSLWTL